MARSTRLPVFGGTLLLLVAGTALATRTPHETPQLPATASHEPEAPPPAIDLTHAVDRLKASGISATDQQVRALATDYGLGGAVRLLAWADASGKSLDELKAMRDAGRGWGEMAHELGLSPGIGSIMGQAGGHGAEDAPGLAKDKPAHPGGDNDEPAEESEPPESPGN